MILCPLYYVDDLVPGLKPNHLPSSASTEPPPESLKRKALHLDVFLFVHFPAYSAAPGALPGVSFLHQWHLRTGGCVRKKRPHIRYSLQRLYRNFKCLEPDWRASTRYPILLYKQATQDDRRQISSLGLLSHAFVLAGLLFSVRLLLLIPFESNRIAWRLYFYPTLSTNTFSPQEPTPTNNPSGSSRSQQNRTKDTPHTQISTQENPPRRIHKRNTFAMAKGFLRSLLLLALSAPLLVWAEQDPKGGWDPDYSIGLHTP